MTTLDEALTAIRENATAAAVECRCSICSERAKLLAALEVVVRLHYGEPYAQGPDYCAECERRYPCPTVQAITTALAGGAE